MKEGKPINEFCSQMELWAIVWSNKRRSKLRDAYASFRPLVTERVSWRQNSIKSFYETTLDLKAWYHKPVYQVDQLGEVKQVQGLLFWKYLLKKKHLGCRIHKKQ